MLHLKEQPVDRLMTKCPLMLGSCSMPCIQYFVKSSFGRLLFHYFSFVWEVCVCVFLCKVNFSVLFSYLGMLLYINYIDIFCENVIYII